MAIKKSHFRLAGSPLRERTVGHFVPTARPTQADLQALRDAAARLEAVMALADGEVDEAIGDFDQLRKAVAERRRASA